MTITHTGNTNLGEFNHWRYYFCSASILKCKTLSTNKNYIFSWQYYTKEQSLFGRKNLIH